MAFSLQGADIAAGAGMNNAAGAGGAGGAGGIHAFGAMAGGTARYNTGSLVDVDGLSLLLGVAKQVPIDRKSKRLNSSHYCELVMPSSDRKKQIRLSHTN